MVLVFLLRYYATLDPHFIKYSTMLPKYTGFKGLTGENNDTIKCFIKSLISRLSKTSLVLVGQVLDITGFVERKPLF